jgi:uncharacterized UBP type Zn finger protein
MEPLITLDTAYAGLYCYVCQKEISVDDNMTIVGVGLSYLPAHRDCFHLNQLPLWYQ